MATYRSAKNICLQPGDAEKPVIEGEFDFETRDFAYDLSAEDDAKYGAALVAEGAVRDDSAQAAPQPVVEPEPELEPHPDVEPGTEPGEHLEGSE